MAGALWFSFNGIRTAEYVINRLVGALCGTDTLARPTGEKLDVLAMRDQRLMHRMG